MLHPLLIKKEEKRKKKKLKKRNIWFPSFAHLLSNSE
jgi:hypothetical protein